METTPRDKGKIGTTVPDKTDINMTTANVPQSADTATDSSTTSPEPARQTALPSLPGKKRAQPALRHVRSALSAWARASSRARSLALGPRSFPWTAPSWPSSVDRPPSESHTGVNFNTGWSRKYPARVARAATMDWIIKPAAAVLATPEVIGLDKLALARGPFIFAANHSSHFDTPLLLTSLPPEIRHRCVVAAASDYFFDRRWKGFLSAAVLGAIPLERERVDRSSARAACELLASGWHLVIFPEGTRSVDGWAQEFRGGAAYLSRRTGCPVVPVHVKGTRAMLAKDSRRLRPGRTRVTFGPALHCLESEDARRFAKRIEAGVAVLADEVSTDWWSALRRSASGETPDLRGPQTSPWRRAWLLEEHHDGRHPEWLR